MSTKKEKCGLCKHETPCPHSRIDNMMGKALQSESIEWETEFDSIPQPDKIQMHMSFSDRDMIDFCQDIIKPFIRKAITTAVAKRELEIAEEVKKLLKEIPTQEKIELTVRSITIAQEAVEFHAHNKAINQVLSLFKH